MDEIMVLDQGFDMNDADNYGSCCAGPNAPID